MAETEEAIGVFFKFFLTSSARISKSPHTSIAPHAFT